MLNRLALLIRERFTEDNHYEIAKAVLEAMREPTPEMIFAGFLDPASRGVDTEYTKEVYQAMIDKALQE